MKVELSALESKLSRLGLESGTQLNMDSIALIL
jgi:hypothetical protein